MDKSWITNRNRLSTEYREGVKQFINVARSLSPGGIDTRCPCRACANLKFQTFSVVDSHLYQYEFTQSYTQWVHHGESCALPPVVSRVDDRVSNDADDHGDGLHELLHDVIAGTYMGDNVGEASTSRISPIREESTVDYVDEFDSLMGDANRQLYPGCTKYSKLHFVIKLMHLKTLNGWSNKSVDMLLELFKDALPEGETLPKSHYEAKSLMSALGLHYIRIHACKNDCVLF